MRDYHYLFKLQNESGIESIEFSFNDKTFKFLNSPIHVGIVVNLQFSILRSSNFAKVLISFGMSLKSLPDNVSF